MNYSRALLARFHRCISLDDSSDDYRRSASSRLQQYLAFGWRLSYRMAHPGNLFDTHVFDFWSSQLVIDFCDVISFIDNPTNL